MCHVCQPISCKIGTLIYCNTLLSISNTNSCQMSAKKHSKAFECLLFFILNKELFKDYVNKTRRMHQRYFYWLRGIIIIMAMERTKWERIRKHLKNHEKEHLGHDENNFFFYSIFYLTTFFNRPFFTFLQQFKAGKNYKVAGDRAGRRRISTTLGFPAKWRLRNERRNSILMTHHY